MNPRERGPHESRLVKNWQCPTCQVWKPWGANSCHTCHPPARGNGITVREWAAQLDREYTEHEIAEGKIPRYHLPKYTQEHHRASGGFVHFWAKNWPLPYLRNYGNINQ